MYTWYNILQPFITCYVNSYHVIALYIQNISKTNTHINNIYIQNIYTKYQAAAGPAGLAQAPLERAGPQGPAAAWYFGYLGRLQPLHFGCCNEHAFMRSKCEALCKPFVRLLCALHEPQVSLSEPVWALGARRLRPRQKLHGRNQMFM